MRSPHASVFPGPNSRPAVADDGVDGPGTGEDEFGRFDPLDDLGFCVRYRFKSSAR